MKSRIAILSLLIAALVVLPSYARAAQVSGHVNGEYIESRTADVYTGPCFANAEVNLAGHEAVLAWHIENGAWGNVDLDGLTVVAVVRASGTIGDVYENPLPAKAVMIVDQRASAEQRAALINFAQAQGGALLADVVAVQSAPMRFEVDSARHGYASLEAGNLVRISTRALTDNDEICHNEAVFYDPLAAHLTHAMPAVATQASYSGNHLGVTWNESNRRSAFVGTFGF